MIVLYLSNLSYGIYWILIFLTIENAVFFFFLFSVPVHLPFLISAVTLSLIPEPSKSEKVNKHSLLFQKKILYSVFLICWNSRESIGLFSIFTVLFTKPSDLHLLVRVAFLFGYAQTLGLCGKGESCDPDGPSWGISTHKPLLIVKNNGSH